MRTVQRSDSERLDKALIWYERVMAIRTETGGIRFATIRTQGDRTDLRDAIDRALDEDQRGEPVYRDEPPR